MQTINRKLFQMMTLLLLTIVLVACGGSRESNNMNNHNGNNHSSNDQPASVAQQPSGDTAANTAGTTVNVIARDFEFIMDANSAAAGATTFAVTNEGSMPHDFAITVNGERYQTKMLQPGESDVITVELPAGSYEYICTVPGHDVLGMKGTFTIN